MRRRARHRTSRLAETDTISAIWRRGGGTAACVRRWVRQRRERRRQVGCQPGGRAAVAGRALSHSSHDGCCQKQRADSTRPEVMGYLTVNRPEKRSHKLLAGPVSCALQKLSSLTEVRGRRQCLCAYSLVVKHPSTRHIGTLAPRPRPPPPSDEASFVLSGKKDRREKRRWATP